MSRVVKNSRRCRPAGQVEDARALHDGVVDVEERRGVRVGRGGRARSRPRPPPPPPRRRAADRCCRLSRVGAGRVGRGHVRTLVAERPASPVWKYPSHGCRTRDRRRGPARRRRPPRTPTGSRSSRPAAARVTWAELDDEVGRLATGLGAAGIVAGHRVLMALGNRHRVRDHLPRRPARPGRRRAGQPAVARPASWPG